MRTFDEIKVSPQRSNEKNFSKSFHPSVIYYITRHNPFSFSKQELDWTLFKFEYDKMGRDTKVLLHLVFELTRDPLLSEDSALRRTQSGASLRPERGSVFEFLHPRAQA